MTSGIYDRTNIHINNSGENNPFYGKHHSQKSKDKISKSNTGKKRPQEIINKIAFLRIGTHHSETTKKKIGDGNRGKIVSGITKKKMSKSQLGNKNGLGKHWKISEKGKLNRLKARCLNLSYVSNPEHLFYLKCLTKFFPIRFIYRQFYLKGLNHSFDFSVPKFKILFEIDGNYFHSLPDRVERDAEINEFVWRTYPDWVLFRFSDENLKGLNI